MYIKSNILIDLLISNFQHIFTYRKQLSTCINKLIALKFSHGYVTEDGLSQNIIIQKLTVTFKTA